MRQVTQRFIEKNYNSYELKNEETLLLSEK